MVALAVVASGTPDNGWNPVVAGHGTRPAHPRLGYRHYTVQDVPTPE
jgi:hypothetical protein